MSPLTHPRAIVTIVPHHSNGFSPEVQTSLEFAATICQYLEGDSLVRFYTVNYLGNYMTAAQLGFNDKYPKLLNVLPANVT